MPHNSAMIRANTIIKNLWIILVPSILTGLLVFQVFRCGNVLNRRNSYLLENLPETTDWVWNALSGSLYPYLYAEDDQPGGGMLANRFPLDENDDKIMKPDLREKKTKWLKNFNKYQTDYRDSVLIPRLPSFTVHYFWCADAHFELSHYLTVLSILHQFRPDKFVIHYLVKPREDPRGYWRWLKDLERDVVLLTLKPLQDSRHCSHDFPAGISQNEFHEAHGVFVLGDIAITNLTRSDVIKMMAHTFFGNSKDSLDISHFKGDRWSQSQLFLVSNSEPFHINQSPGKAFLSCPSVTEFNNVKSLENTPCVTMHSYISSEELLNRDLRFFRYARTLMYGSPEPIRAQPHEASQTFQFPNIFHIILNDESSRLTPLHYVSIKSAFIYGKAGKVYIHSHKRPSGELWERLLYSDKLKPIYVPTGTSMSPSKKHSAKMYMLYTLLQHGGVASFGDTVFIKPLTSSSPAKAIASLHRSQYRQAHRSLNTAIMAATPGSEFIRDLLGLVHQIAQSWPSMNPDDAASHLLEVDARKIFIDSQLISHQECVNDKCLTSGGHNPPQMSFSVQLIWKTGEPKTLNQIAKVDGPIMKEVYKLVR